MLELEKNATFHLQPCYDQSMTNDILLQEYIYVQNDFRFVTFYIYYAMLLLQLVLSCIAEPKEFVEVQFQIFFIFSRVMI